MLVCRKIGRCHNCYTEIVKFQISNKNDVDLIKYCRQCKIGKTPMLNPSLQVLQSEFP